MKAIYILYVFALFSCKNQETEKIIVNDTSKEQGITLQKLEEIMTEQELESLKKQGYQRKTQDTILMKDGRLDIKSLEEKGKKRYTNADGYYYQKILEDGRYIYIFGDKLSGYSKKITREDEDFGTLYTYHPSGMLKTTGMYYKDYFAKGTWYWYNQRGLINRLEEYDKQYRFTWEDVLTFMQEKQIKKENVMYIRRGVEQDKNQKKPYWYVTKITGRDSNNKPTTAIGYELDGNTGKILKEESLDFSLEY